MTFLKYIEKSVEREPRSESRAPDFFASGYFMWGDPMVWAKKDISARELSEILKLGHP